MYAVMYVDVYEQHNGIQADVQVKSLMLSFPCVI